MSELIKVSAKSRSTAVAGAIAGVMRESGFAELQAIGASAVNQSIKALAIARGYLKEDGIDIAAVPSFTEVILQGAERTAVHMAVYKQSQLLAQKDEAARAQAADKGQAEDGPRSDKPLSAKTNGYSDRVYTGVIVPS